jgi:hypothetical protein
MSPLLQSGWMASPEIIRAHVLDEVATLGIFAAEANDLSLAQRLRRLWSDIAALPLPEAGENAA